MEENFFRTDCHCKTVALHQHRARIRAQNMEEMSQGVFKRHYLVASKKSCFMMCYDEDADEIKDYPILWKPEYGEPIDAYALSTTIAKGVKWLMDTGCGHDLTGQDKARSIGATIVQDDDMVEFQTANGFTTTSSKAKIDVPEIAETVEPFVLNNTPTVLSIGRRCMRDGYSVTLHGHAQRGDRYSVCQG